MIHKSTTKWWQLVSWLKEEATFYGTPQARLHKAIQEAQKRLEPESLEAVDEDCHRVCGNVHFQFILPDES